MDADGDRDLAARGVWRNLADSTENHWLQVEAVGCGATNRDAVGARVEVRQGDETQLREVVAARGTGSQDSRVQHFGLGADGTPVDVRVTFPSGQLEELTGVAVDRRLRVTEVGAWLTPTTWTADLSEPVTITADTCGHPNDPAIRWDLDADGAFDDGTGASAEVAFARPGRYPVAAEVGDGDTLSVSDIAIVVEGPTIFLPRVLADYEVPIIEPVGQ
jgi:hypothetical protein